MASKSSRPCTGCGQPFEPSRPYHRLCWECWQEPTNARRHERLPAEPLLDAGTLRIAVALTHPDRHPPERAEQATRTTQALTAALARVREIEAAA